MSSTSTASSSTPAGGTPPDTITPADRSRPLPLSPAQQRLWFISGFDAKASVAYHITGALRLRGALDGTALRAALDHVVARHEALRTRFVEADGQPWQHIDLPRGFELREQGVSAADATLFSLLTAAVFALASLPGALVLLRRGPRYDRPAPSVEG